MGRKVNMDKLLEKIAAATSMDVDELKEKRKATNLYSHDEMAMEMQATINFFHTRVQPRPPTKERGESDLDFAHRQVEFDKAYNSWRFRICEGCKLEFAYAYHYEGVKFCSLDCLSVELEKIGLSVTPGRDLTKRWGVNHPAIVSSSALGLLKQLYEPSAEWLASPDL